MKRSLLCWMALCVLMIGCASFAETEREIVGDYWKYEYLMENTLSIGKGTAYNLTTNAIVSTNLRTSEVKCSLYIQKIKSAIEIGCDEVEELLIMLPILKDSLLSECRGKTAYVFETKSGVQVGVTIDEAATMFVFQIAPNDSMHTYDITEIDRLLKYLTEYAEFFREECQ